MPNLTNRFFFELVKQYSNNCNIFKNYTLTYEIIHEHTKSGAEDKKLSGKVLKKLRKTSKIQ